MPKTLLAVDDSATMRKVLEITFSGEDFTVVTADSSQAALGKLGDKPAAILIDTTLGGDDGGYALAKEARKKDPGVAIVLLASRYAPYDAAKGKDSGADDFMDKPFDTQQMIEKVRKVLLTKEGAPAAAAPAAKPAPAPTPAPVVVAAAAPAPAPAAAAASKPGRSQTLVFGEPAPGSAPAAKPAAAEAKPQTPAPSTPMNMGHGAPPAQTASSSVSTSVNGHLAGKLSDLGLTASQADAVLALSREVVERVVWEVVPQLAEAIVEEEILRLTKV